MLSVPPNPGTNRCLATSPPSGLAWKSSITNEATTTPTSAVIPASSRRKPICWSPRIAKAPAPAMQAGGEQRDSEQQVEPERGADHLGDVGRHRDRLGLEPEADRGPAREVLAAELGKVLAGGDAELRRLGLDHHRDQVGREDHPEQQVAELGAAGDVGREVARVDVGDRGDERGAEERPDAPRPAAAASSERRAAAATARLAGEDVLDLDLGSPRAAAASRIGSLTSHLRSRSASPYELVAEGVLAAADLDQQRPAEGLAPGDLQLGAGPDAALVEVAEHRRVAVGDADEDHGLALARPRRAACPRRRGARRSGPGIGSPCGSWLGSPSFAAISRSRSSEM